MFFDDDSCLQIRKIVQFELESLGFWLAQKNVIGRNSKLKIALLNCFVIIRISMLERYLFLRLRRIKIKNKDIWDKVQTGRILFFVTVLANLVES